MVYISLSTSPLATIHFYPLATLAAANMLRVLLLSAALVVSVSPSQSSLALHISYKHFMGSVRYIQHILANTAQKYENKFILFEICSVLKDNLYNLNIK